LRGKSGAEGDPLGTNKKRHKNPWFLWRGPAQPSPAELVLYFYALLIPGGIGQGVPGEKEEDHEAAYCGRFKHHAPGD
jgi:hypothetical protein